MKMSDKEKGIASHIGYFFLEECNDIEKALEYVGRLRITGIRCVDQKLTIELGSPGLLIGRRGETIEKLKRYLEEKLQETIQIHFEENPLHTYLTSFDEYI